MRQTKRNGNGYRLDSGVKRWLKADDPEDGEGTEEHFQAWLESKERGEGIVEMGPKIWVDESVFRTRFACVPQRCAPGPGQDKWRCCCSDLFVPLTPVEIKKLGGMQNELADFMARVEPRLYRVTTKRDKGRALKFWLDEDGDALAQPNDRCVFSRWESDGRIRCHLYSFARKHRIQTIDIQPYTCRLFPLLMVQMERGRVLLTVLDRANYRSWESLPPWRLPCLSDPSLPLLVDSMASTLDWVFGKGFARDLKKKGNELKILGEAQSRRKRRRLAKD